MGSVTIGTNKWTVTPDASNTMTLSTSGKYLDRNIEIPSAKSVVGSIGFSNISLTTTNKDSDISYIPIVTTAGASEKQWSNSLTIPSSKRYSITLTAGQSTSSRTELTCNMYNSNIIHLKGTATSDTFAILDPGQALGNFCIGNWTVENRTTRGYVATLQLLGHNTNTSYPDRINSLRVGTSETNKNSIIDEIINYGTISELKSGSSTTGDLYVNAYNDNSTPALTGKYLIVEKGKWNMGALVSLITPKRTNGENSLSIGKDSTGVYAYFNYGWWPNYNSTGKSYIYLPESQIGSATASQVAAGKTFTSSAGVKLTGTMANAMYANCEILTTDDSKHMKLVTTAGYADQNWIKRINLSQGKELDIRNDITDTVTVKYTNDTNCLNFIFS